MDQPIRLGLLEMYASSVLTALPKSLRDTFIVKCANSPTLIAEMNEGRLDIACLFSPPTGMSRNAVTWREDIVWVHGPLFSKPDHLPLPVIGTDVCEIHRAAIHALEEYGIPYRVVFEGSISMKIAAAKEGFGVLAMPRWAVPPSLVEADDLDLPPIPRPLAAICYRDGFDAPDAELFRTALTTLAAQFADRPERRELWPVSCVPKPIF